MRPGRILAAAALLLLVAGVLFFARQGARTAMRPAAPDAGAKAVRHRAGPPPWAADPDAPRGAIEGIVRDPDGKPVDGAVVAAVPKLDLEDRDEATELKPAAVAPSKDGGHYRLENVRPGEYGVTATAAGFTPGHHGGVTLMPGETLTGVDVTLGKGGVVLSGRVLDSGGGPIPGAEVRGLPTMSGQLDSTQMFVTRAGADGGYKVPVVKGWYSLSADADGYARESTWLAVQADTTHDFHLNPAARVSGRVVERAGGKPVPGASVRVEQDDGWWFEPRETKTDDAGVFAFAGLDPGSYTFHAQKGPLVGQSARAVAVTLAAHVSDVVVEVDHGRSIAGHVRKTGGAAVEGAKVRLDGNRWGGGGRVRATSDADGAYRIEGVLPARYGVSVEAKEYAPAQRNVVVAEADVDGVDFLLAVEAVVNGRVLDKEGQPVAGAAVTAFVRPAGNAWGPGASFGRDRSKDDGSFRIGGLGPGTLVVSAAHPDKGRGQAADLALGGGEHKDVTVRLESGAFVSGTVHWDDGAPAVAVTVRGFSMGGMGSMPNSTKTGPDGGYRVGPFQTGNVMVQALRKEGGLMFMMGPGARQDRRSVEITEPNGQVTGIDLVLDKGGLKISGFVFDADGKPLGGASVAAQAEMMGRNPRLIARMPSFGANKVASGEDGSFTLDDLNKGTYVVYAEVAGLAEAQAYPVAAGTTDVKVQFKRPSVLAGVAVGAQSGKPLSDYTIAAMTAQGPAQTDDQRLAARFGGAQASASVHDPSGAFEMRGVPDGTYDLVVTTADGRGGRLAGVVVAAGDEKRDLRVTVKDGVAARGRVVDLDSGQPLPGVTVTESASAGIMLGGGQANTVTTDAQGAFKVTGLVAGRTTHIMAMGDMQAYVPEQKEIAVPEGQAEIDVGAIRLLKGSFMSRGLNAGSPGITPDNHDGHVVADVVRPDSPAAKAGVKSGEPITTIDGRDVHDFGPNAAGYLLRGKVGTSVQVGLGESRSLTLERAPM